MARAQDHKDVRSAHPDKGGPWGYGQPKSVDRVCENFKKGKCVYGEECIFQHTE